VKVDIDGAKALAERLSRTAGARQPASVEVPDGAPPIYHWFGIGKKNDGVYPDDGSSTPGPGPLDPRAASQ
jgi:hypothetical protein